VYLFVLICVVVSVSQGWTPVSHGSGRGRWSILSGSGGRHHRAHSALHPGGGSQHLQRHADEPQLCSAHTGARQLANQPDQVGVPIWTHSKSGSKSEDACNQLHLLLPVALRTIIDSTPTVLKEWVRAGGCVLAECHLASYWLFPHGEALPSLKPDPAPPGSTEVCPDRGEPAASRPVPRDAPERLLWATFTKDPQITDALVSPDPRRGPMALRRASRRTLTPSTSSLTTPVPELVL